MGWRQLTALYSSARVGAAAARVMGAGSIAAVVMNFMLNGQRGALSG